MLHSVLLRTIVLLPICAPLAAHAEQPATMRYTGTIGQQRVSLLLNVEDDAVRGGSLTYSSQKGEIRIVDSRQFGTTVVLQDEDGDILHLHFEDAAGGKTGTFQSAERLEGTLDRGDLDVPVALQRARLEPGTR